MPHAHTVNSIPSPSVFAYVCDTAHAHDATHDLDTHVATDTATGRTIDFCYDCNDLITRGPGNVPVGRDAVAESLIRTIAR